LLNVLQAAIVSSFRLYKLFSLRIQSLRHMSLFAPLAPTPCPSKHNRSGRSELNVFGFIYLFSLAVIHCKAWIFSTVTKIQIRRRRVLDSIVDKDKRFVSLPLCPCRFWVSPNLMSSRY
jgi:hypothetical protein